MAIIDLHINDFGREIEMEVNNLNELHLKPERHKWLILEMINW